MLWCTTNTATGNMCSEIKYIMIINYLHNNLTMNYSVYLMWPVNKDFYYQLTFLDYTKVYENVQTREKYNSDATNLFLP